VRKLRAARSAGTRVAARGSRERGIVSEFVGGTREAEIVGRGRERSACPGTRTLTRTRPAHANRAARTEHATAHGHASRLATAV
jgi:hypothetical protein